MNDPNESLHNTNETEAPKPVRSHAGWRIAAFLAALAASNGFLLWKMDRQRQDLTSEIAAMRETIAGEMSSLRTSTSAKTRETEESLRQQLDAARRQAAAAVGKAKIEAVRHAEQLTQQLAAEQQKQQQEVAGELSGLKDATSAISAKTTEVGGEVKNVKSELDSALSDLKSVRGDLGIQSGLIATNAKELAALKALGERKYFEFSLTKSKEPQMVGNIRLALVKADPKRNKYTLNVIADDKRIEKRDKTANEPVQFYVMGARLPYEIVVNEVRKDAVVGYLATPKAVEMASR